MASGAPRKGLRLRRPLPEVLDHVCVEAEEEDGEVVYRVDC